MIKNTILGIPGIIIFSPTNVNSNAVRITNVTYSWDVIITRCGSIIFRTSNRFSAAR